MATEAVIITIDNKGQVRLHPDPLTVEKPTTIIWQLNAADRRDWHLVGISVDGQRKGMEKQLTDWSYLPEQGSVSSHDICTRRGEIKYSILYRRKHPSGPVLTHDPIIRNEPPQGLLEMFSSQNVTLSVDIESDGTVRTPGKDDTLVVTRRPVTITWRLTDTAAEDFELVDIAFAPPAPPVGEFTTKVFGRSTRGRLWVRMVDNNRHGKTFPYSLVYRRRSDGELLAFDPTIKNVPPD